ncbi:PROTEIN BIG GRAIN 1-LIKE A [Salix purpurea]|uniref:PROTEIN BIG GRAIN 1-LIKE A n=1 Tax=Salix purpurea TaxID=77065 RepID=A0A9Q0T348_SALPP|nr:PROTEIN BIG GRAIN 1-LIKE A [Salix purpurea]
MYKKERSSRESAFPPRRRTPSFSSTLLDSIYRSIDEPSGEQQLVTGIKKQSCSSVSTSRRDASFREEEKEGCTPLRRAVRNESWVEKRSTRGSTPYSSTSSSSDSSSAGGGGGVFSSSENDSSVKRNSSFRQQRTKPLSDKPHQKPKCEGGGFHKTKLRALKIYGELKKVKQPISPGGRIASFLNSIFNSASAAKKVKICSIGAMEDVSFERKSKKPACSSVTPFSRSCLSKTPPPPRGKPSNGTKRSVRFYPVSVIVDEDSRPCGHKCIYEDDPGLMPMPRKAVKSNPVKELEVAKGAAADYLRSHRQKKNASEFGFRGFHGFGEDDSDSDDESCASSDLFELDHLIGIGRFREELPVYETTNLKTNQAIANGFFP